MYYTATHGWPVPESGDDPEVVAEAIEETLAQIDEMTINRDEPSARPDPGNPHRLFLNLGDLPPTLHVDVGDEWQQVGGLYNTPENLARTDVQETITETWQFDEPILADITGTAAYAENADHAEFADECGNVSDTNIDSLLVRDQPQRIEGQYTYEQEVVFDGGFQADGGTIDLPRYEGDDPPLEERSVGSMWWRDDDQPTR